MTYLESFHILLKLPIHLIFRTPILNVVALLKVLSSERMSRPRVEGTSRNLTMTLARRQIFLSLPWWNGTSKGGTMEIGGLGFGGQEGWNCPKVNPDGYLFFSFSLVHHSSLHHFFFFSFECTTGPVITSVRNEPNQTQEDRVVVYQIKNSLTVQSKTVCELKHPQGSTGLCLWLGLFLSTTCYLFFYVSLKIHIVTYNKWLATKT